jgi:hypothetical protein
MHELNSLMSIMFPDVDMLGALTTANNGVTPFDASGVVLEQRSRSRTLESESTNQIA